MQEKKIQNEQEEFLGAEVIKVNKKILYIRHRGEYNHMCQPLTCAEPRDTDMTKIRIQKISWGPLATPHGGPELGSLAGLR